MHLDVLKLYLFSLYSPHFTSAVQRAYQNYQSICSWLQKYFILNIVFT